MTTRTYPPELRIDAASIVPQITDFITRQVEDSGIPNVVMGLSGGVDSAVVAALCVRALGTERVHPFVLPYSSSSEESRLDAEAVAIALNLRVQSVDISPLADPYFLERSTDPVRKGNVLARLRMTVLFDQARAHDALVAGTGNKTEMYLGYCTWYGDSACSFAPIADLYKSQVWQLAEYLDVPQRVIDKVPTADLWPGQTDEGELGIEYADADRILHAMLERHVAPDRLTDVGFDDTRVERVVDTMRRTEFKRQLPSVAYVQQGITSSQAT